MGLIDNIKKAQPRRKTTLAGRVREGFAEIAEALGRGVSWKDLALAFRQSGIKVTAHSLRSTFYQVSEAIEAEAMVLPAASPSVDSSQGASSAGHEKPAVIGLDAQGSASQMQAASKQEASEQHGAGMPLAVASQPQADSSSPQGHVKPSERVAALASQPRPAAPAGLTNADGFVQNIPDEEL